MDRRHARATIRIAVAAPFPEIVRIHESTAEYADELEVCAMISDADTVLDLARVLQPDVLLLSEGLGADRADTLARLSAVAPGTRLVVLASEEAGAEPLIADAVVRLGASAAELRHAIVTVVGRTDGTAAPAAHTREHAAPRGASPWQRIAGEAEAIATPATPPVSSLPVPVEVVVETVGSSDDPQVPVSAPQTTKPGSARTVLVFSGKGGVGKSVVATNLATALAVRGSRVALVDLNLQYGDVGVLLHLEAHPMTIDAVVRQGEAVDPAALERALATSAQGVRVLLAPASPESSDVVTAAAVEAILNQLTRTHDYVVIDSPPQLEEHILGVMEVADQILLVSSFGITSVKDAKVTLRLLQSLGVERDRVALVVNQTRPRITFGAEEIERALRFPILGNLPYEPRMDERVDSGRPLVVSEPRSGFSRQIALIVEHVGGARSQDAASKVRRHATRWRLRLRH